MADEVEAATLDSLSGLFRRSKPRVTPAGGVCDNCQAVMHGGWCHACGQKGGEARRSIMALVAQAFEGVFQADGRLWRTLPRLFLRPGRLTLDYTEGKRAPQAPPFSMYLVVVVLFIFVGEMTQERTAPRPVAGTPAAAVQMAGLAPEAGDEALVTWIKSRGRLALAEPERFAMVAQTWEQRAAILMLPIAALLLTGLFVFQRRFMVYDHLVFSMHSLTFGGLVLSVWMLATVVIGSWALWLWFLLPIHLFVHMRGAYQTGVWGTLTRMGLLGLGSVICFGLLLLGLILIALQDFAG